MIGKNLKRIRIDNGLTQEEVAKKLCITNSMLCQLERGTKVLTVPLAVEICELYDININEIL